MQGPVFVKQLNYLDRYLVLYFELLLVPVADKYILCLRMLSAHMPYSYNSYAVRFR